MKQKTNKIIALAMLAFMVTLFMCARYVSKSKKCIDHTGDIFIDLISGVVIEKYVNKRNRGIPTIKLNDKSIIPIVSYDKNGLFGTLKLGDSIYKPSNSYLFQVYQDDSFFVYDFSKDCCRIDGSGCN